MTRNYSDKRTQKETKDADLEAIETTDFEYNKPKDQSSEMMKTITENSYAKDFAKLDPVADFADTPQSKNEIEHRPEAQIYSKSHTLPDECFDKGTKVRGMTKTAQTDDTASGKKGKTPQKSDYTDEQFDEDMLSGLA